ncbi:LytTR family transcriptional regulator DNA-binding domain-containing protein [Luteibacter aegosomaticola]|uniref:LytR/AlgR family response regulator transcription factor n=1 Tax=Luteibacter aegosomaticola TaxID=2911538 RepID=UPI001FF7BC7B|nr:LytTR family DNA-binding domain-containing protein [Luteibacter aegosomaticola]UPG89454.1 LytTR family transcriptional regulator DNA-binding domain-containing protein [Luteibacter aegosomaticola]
MKQRRFDLLAVGAIFIAYTITIRLALGLDLKGSLLGGVANTIPVVIFGLAVRRIVVSHLMGRPPLAQLVAHVFLCAAYMLLSYGLLIVLLGVFYGGGPGGFVVKPFHVGAAAWQSLENVTTYALIAAVSYLQGSAAAAPRPDAHEPAPPLASAQAEQATATTGTPDPATPEARPEPAPTRYFVKIGDELRPLDLASVVSIRGAGDYAEVQAATGTHLVRVTLTDFASSLDPARYVRVHRSWIVNTDRIAWAEPAGGGRLLLHLDTGQTISTSREGARLLRNRVI